MKKFKITNGNRVYIVDAKSHIDAINKVKSVKDSVIRDYSPEVYVNELEKLIPEYIKLDKLRDKIIESLKSSGKIDSSNWRQTDKYINDAKVQQWLKQVKELDKKWNKLLDNLSRFKGTQSYRRDTNSSDKDIWLDDVPYPREIKGIQSDIEIIGFLKGSMKNKDSISQWKPGMSEIGLFQISYKKGTVYQSILVKAATKEDAINKFTKHTPDAEVIGVNEYPNPHFGEPILDSSIKDDWSRGISVTVRVDTASLINAAKSDKIRIGSGYDSPEKLIGSTSLRFRLPNGDNTAYLDMDRNQSEIKYNLYDNDFTYKEFGGKSDVNKAKLTEGLKKLEQYVVNQLKSAGIRVNQSKVEVGGSSKFNSVWRQAQSYNDASRISDTLSNSEAEKSARAKKGLDSSIKDAYIEEWWGQSGENPNTVARRYGVSVKQLKRNNDQILYRFEGDINKLNRMHSDGYFMSIDMDGNSIKDGNNQLSAPKNLRVGSRIQTRNGTYTIIAIDNNDIATIQYENGRKFKLALYDIIDELDNVYTTKIIK